MDAAQAKKLREPFKPEQIGKLPKPTKKENPKGRCKDCGGWHGLPAVHLDYVGHAGVTDRLLQVDPEWTWEPMAYGPNGEPMLTNGGLWIKLTVCGVTRPGFGDEGNGKGMKEIIGDAIRNAAMRFGVALDLWSKEDLHKDSAGEPEPSMGAASLQGQDVSQTDGPQPAESASPAEESFAAQAERAQKAGAKATKAQLAEIESLVDVCAAARGKTSDEIWAPLANDGYVLAELRRDQAEELIGKLNRWASQLEAAA